MDINISKLNIRNISGLAKFTMFSIFMDGGVLRSYFKEQIGLFLGGHHLYMNLCVSMCLCVCPSLSQKLCVPLSPPCGFLHPPKVNGTLGHQYNGTLGHQDTGTQTWK